LDSRWMLTSKRKRKNSLYSNIGSSY